MSTVYVKGENLAINFPRAGNLSKDINIPLIKIIGMRTRFESIIMLEGVSVAGEESKTPKQEKQKLDKTIAVIKIIKLLKPTARKGMLTRNNPKVIAVPKRKPANMSPKRINPKDTGQLISLSKVRILVSQGAIIGPTEEEVKNTAIAITAGNRELIDTFLPRKKAKNKKKGKIRPYIRTGDFR